MAREVVLAICLLVAVSMPAATAGDTTPVLVRAAATAVAVSDDGRVVATTGADGVRVWDRRTGTSLRVLSSRGRSEVDFAGMTGNGRRLLLVQPGRTISQSHLAMWDSKTRRTTVITKDLGTLFSTDLSPDGRFVTYSRDVRDADHAVIERTASLWDRRTGRVTVLARGSWFGYLTSVSRDGELVVVTDLGSEETFAYERATGVRTVLTTNSSRGLSLAAADGDVALVSSDEALSDDDTDSSSDVYLWDRATGDFRVLTGGLDRVALGAGVSADGAVAILYTDVVKTAVGSLRVWRAEDGRAGRLASAVPDFYGGPGVLSGPGTYVAYTEYSVGAVVAGL